MSEKEQTFLCRFACIFARMFRWFEKAVLVLLMIFVHFAVFTFAIGFYVGFEHYFLDGERAMSSLILMAWTMPTLILSIIAYCLTILTWKAVKKEGNNSD